MFCLVYSVLKIVKFFLSWRCQRENIQMMCQVAKKKSVPLVMHIAKTKKTHFNKLVSFTTPYLAIVNSVANCLTPY